MADYGPHIGKRGWQDWSIVAFALANDYVIVTNNRRHFLREYSRLDIHNGLLIIVPNVERDDQARLFGKALDAALALGDDLLNKVIEVLRDGTVHIQEWTNERHEPGHIDAPTWR